MKNPVDLCVRWAMLWISVNIILPGLVWSLLSLPWGTRTAWTSPRWSRETGWELLKKPDFYTLLQVERGGEVFRTSCDICCESVPLLRQPGRSLTCEVRGFKCKLLSIDWMSVLKMQTTNKDNNWFTDSWKKIYQKMTKFKNLQKILSNSCKSSGEVGQCWEISEKQNSLVSTQHTPNESITKWKLLPRH